MKFLYLASSRVEYSVNGVYISGLIQNNVDIVSYAAVDKGFRKFINIAKFYFENRQGADLIIVGDDSPEIVNFLFFLTRKKIVYNALCSVYERLVVSRNKTSLFSPKAIYYWLLDFLACRFAAVVMLESAHQIQYFKHLFWLSAKKSFLAWTGVDEKNYFYNSDLKKFDDFTVIFRGRLLPEAGGEVIVRAAKLLEGSNIKVLMHSFGLELEKIKKIIEELKPSNFVLITDFLPIEQVRETMQKSHLSLGQLSSHDRLQRTIPHKAYESLALKLPYLTARNPAVLELLEDGKTCLTFNPGDEKDLADKIIWAKDNVKNLDEIAQNGYEFFVENLTSKVLAKKLIDRLKNNKII